MFLIKVFKFFFLSQVEICKLRGKHFPPILKYVLIILSLNLIQCQIGSFMRCLRSILQLPASESPKLNLEQTERNSLLFVRSRSSP